MNKLIVVITTLIIPFFAQALSPVHKLEVDIRNAYENLEQDGKPIAWEVFGPRDRIAYSCKQLCGCIANRLSAAVSSHEHSLLVARALGGFYMKNRQGFKVWYGFHVVLAIQLEDQNTYIVDPMIFGDVKLHPKTEWESKFIDLKSIRFETVQTKSN